MAIRSGLRARTDRLWAPIAPAVLLVAVQVTAGPYSPAARDRHLPRVVPVRARAIREQLLRLDATIEAAFPEGVPERELARVPDRAGLGLAHERQRRVPEDQYIVVVALPEIGRELDYSAHTLQLVISAYAVASAGFLLLGGRAADLLGPRRVFVSGLALYAGASLVGGLAPAPEVLLAARAVRGSAERSCFPRPSRWSTPRSPRAASATAP